MRRPTPFIELGVIAVLGCGDPATLTTPPSATSSTSAGAGGSACGDGSLDVDEACGEGLPTGGTGGEGGLGFNWPDNFPEPDWSCLGTLAPPSFQPGTAVVEAVAYDAWGSVPPSGSRVASCLAADPSCDSPLDIGFTDDVGSVMLEATTAEPMFFELTRPEPWVMPHRFHINGPPTELSFLPWLEGDFAPGIDPSRGHVMVLFRDCLGHRVAGGDIMASTADDASVPSGVVFVGGVLDTAYRLLYNVPLGPAVITGYTGDEAMQAVSSRPVIITAGSMSVVTVSPVPAP